MKETKQRIIKSNLKTLLKRYSRSDAFKNLESGFNQESIHKISPKIINDSKYLKKISFTPEELEEYKEGLKSSIYQPLVVRMVGNSYEIVVGRHFLYAAKELNLETIDCLVKTFSDEEALLVTASFLRGLKGTQVVEEACICYYLKKDFHYKNKDLCTLFKQSPSQVSNIIRLSELDSKVFSLIAKNKISYGHAKAFSRLNNEEINYVVNEILDKHLSVRETEQLVHSINNNSEINSNIIVTKNKITLSFDSKAKKDEALKRIEKYVKRGKIRF